jgi:hypothetical protein
LQVGTSGNNFFLRFTAPVTITTVSSPTTNVSFILTFEYSRNNGTTWNVLAMSTPDTVIAYDPATTDYSKSWTSIAGLIANDLVRVSVRVDAIVPVTLYTSVTPTIVAATGYNATALQGVSTTSTWVTVNSLPIITFSPLTDTPNVTVTINTKSNIVTNHYNIISSVVYIVVYKAVVASTSAYIFDSTPITSVVVNGNSSLFQYNAATSTTTNQQVFSLLIPQSTVSSRVIAGLIICVQLSNGISAYAYSPTVWPRMLHSNI